MRVDDVLEDVDAVDEVPGRRGAGRRARSPDPQVPRARTTSSTPMPSWSGSTPATSAPSSRKRRSIDPAP
uniref:Uncharacterized protein n=1 Tax=Janibacter limosus TaxID=53458 RepID=A0AC61U0T3_9MICO|nr:hypothetical protein [Janibacter limosus]